MILTRTSMRAMEDEEAGGAEEEEAAVAMICGRSALAFAHRPSLTWSENELNKRRS